MFIFTFRKLVSFYIFWFCVALPSLCVVRLEVRLRLGSFFRLSGGERFYNSLLKLGLRSFLPFGNWVCLTFFCHACRGVGLAKSGRSRVDVIGAGGVLI